LVDGADVVSKSSGDRNARTVGRERLAASALQGVLTDDGLTRARDCREMSVSVTLGGCGISLRCVGYLKLFTKHRPDSTSATSNATDIDATPDFSSPRINIKYPVAVAVIVVQEVANLINHSIRVKIFVDGWLQFDAAVECINLVERTLELIFGVNDETSRSSAGFATTGLGWSW
jgi:hypothetical protein